MYAVSDTYKSEIKNRLRNTSHIKVTFGVIDPQAEADSTISSTDSEIYSEPNSIDKSFTVYKPYGRIYENGFILDDTLYTAEPNTDNYQGYLPQSLSNGLGEYTTPPTVVIDFTDFISFGGLTFMFDEFTNNYPTKIKVDSYANNVLIDSITESCDDVFYVFEHQIPTNDFADRVIISFLETNFPYRDLRLSNLTFGITKIFDDTDIVSAEFTQKVDLINSFLPTEKFSFQIRDANKEYNPESPTGLWKYLEEGQIVSVDIGYKLSTDEVEWQPLCNYYTDGTIEIESNLIPVVKINTISLLSYLDDRYLDSVFHIDGITLYDLALELFDSVPEAFQADGTPKFILDDVLKTFSTATPLPLLTVRDNLQLIASAGGCTVFTNRDGLIEIKKISYSSIPSMDLMFEDMYKIPPLKKYPLLRDVIVTHNKVELETTTTNIYSQDIENANETYYEFEHAPATNLTIALTGTLQIIGTALTNVNATRITLTGTGTITISGKAILLTQLKNITRFGSVGDDCPVTNMLINTDAHVTAYTSFIANYVKLRNEYEFTDRGFPEMDIGDIINTQTQYNDNALAIISKKNIKYNGVISGDTKYYMLGGG